MEQPIPFTVEEEKTLVYLLDKVFQNGGFWPSQHTFELSQKIRPALAVEVIILRRVKRDTKILLSVYHHLRKFPEFEGKWHVPGGYVLPTDYDLEAACKRNAKKDFGVDVKLLRILGNEWWGSGDRHPHGRPFSVLVECEPLAQIREHDELRFFPLNNLPREIISVHERFIRKFVFTR